jgi:hypothetical protein
MYTLAMRAENSGKLRGGQEGLALTGWPFFICVTIKPRDIQPVMTREEIGELMEELTRQFAATLDPEIREELYELAKQLEQMEKMERENKN